jgi:hypothetical protein
MPLHASRPFQPISKRDKTSAVYDLKAVPMGGDPCIITISDMLQIERGPHLLSMNKQQRSVHTYPIFAETIAKDIIHEWAFNGPGMTEGRRPGVWMVRDTLPELDENGNQLSDEEGRALRRPATEAEIKSMFEEDLRYNRMSDNAFAMHEVEEANAEAENPKLIKFITERKRAAVVHLGIETPWVKLGSSLETKACQFCKSVIVKASIICRVCHQVVDYHAFAAEEAKRGAEVDRLAKQLKEGPPTPPMKKAG